MFIRYLWKDEVREDFVGYIDARKSAIELDRTSSEEESENSTVQSTEPTLTGIKLGQMIMRELKRLVLDTKSCVGITTHGCAINTSETVGATQEIQKVAVHAVKCPCYNHQ